MNRLFRLLWLLLRSRWLPACPPVGPCQTALRVWPNDLDVFRHVNNGVYFTLCDLARVDLMLRSGSLGITSGRRRILLVAGETIQLLRPLRLFQPFVIETRVLGWDEKAVFVEHRFRARFAAASAADAEETVAVAVVEGRVHDRRDGHVPPAEILSELRISGDSPALPGWVARWREDQRALREVARAEKASSGVK